MSEWKNSEIGLIPKNWSTNKADNYCLRVTDGTHDTPKPQKEGKYLITSKHIIGGRIDLSSAYKISIEDFDAVNLRSKVEQWDILYSMIGTVGETALVEEGTVDFAIKNVGLFKCGKEIKAHWLKYYFRSPFAIYHLKSRLSGTTQKYITLGELRKFPILYPENQEEQKSIVSILSSLDNKIDLLRRQNETLEAIAQTLFKRWFVEFEFPNKEGQPYKSSGGKMVSSELGEIPEGWRVIELSELVETITKGTTPTTLGKKFVDKGINFIKAESITSNHTFDKNKFAHIDEQTDQLLKRSKIQDGDFLYTIAGTIGRFAVVTERVLPANTNQAIAIIRLKKNLNILPYQLLCYLKSNFYQTYLRSRIVQAVQANLSLGELKNTPIIFAENSVQSKFSIIAKSLFKKIEKNEELIELLVKMRDILLPKLMSGQIRVKGN